jgi:precorrin-6B C5,15-methyltransferase / cobalt-precorrin-6B C5,C15-methyltransferase
MTAFRITVAGIGADGWAGLGQAAREALLAAPLVVGSHRQLDLLPPSATAPGAVREPWPSPLEPALDALAAGARGDAVVLASGDPMLHGIGSSLVRRGLTPPALHVIPHPSAFALACARLGWPAAETELISTVARDPAHVARALQPGRRLVVYATGARGAATIARVLVERGFGPSRFVVLEQLGSDADERLHEATAETWGERPADPLHAIAIEPRPAAGASPLPSTPGLPDDAFDHDGQLTKRHVRAVTVAALAPLPGELLWDVGAGNGSIAIEWLRAGAHAAAPPTRAVAFERDLERAARIAANARTLGVPHLQTVTGSVPAVFADPLVAHGAPDAVFLGGGLTAPGVLEGAWHALKPGGRFVANAVTLESQARLLRARAEHGGTLTQISLSHAGAVGSFTGWRAQMPVVQWEARKEDPTA